MENFKILVCFILQLACLHSFSQNEKLYLIYGKTKSTCPVGTCPVQLLELDKKQLNVVIDIVKVDSTYDYEDYQNDTIDRCYKIGIYHSLKTAIVFTNDNQPESYKFYILKFSEKFKVDTLKREFPSKSSTNYIYYVLNINQTPYLTFEYSPDFSKKDRIEYYYAINLDSYRDTTFKSNDIINNLHSEGEQGIALCERTSAEESECLLIRTEDINNTIVNKIVYPRIKSLDTAIFNMPEKEQYLLNDPKRKIPSSSPNSRLPLQIANKDFIVYRSDILWDIKNGGQRFSFYDAEIRKWQHTPYLKGFSLAGLRNFGVWLAGYVTFEYQYGYDQRILKYGSIPSIKYRKQISRFGKTFDERINQFKQFPEGILYLYNMKTFKYIEWDAFENGEHQGDSEILLVQDDTVYYRINDKIYSAVILNGEKLGEATLLVEDPRVPDVHWAFLSKQE